MTYLIVFGLGIALGLIGGLYGLVFAMGRAVAHVERIVAAVDHRSGPGDEA